MIALFGVGTLVVLFGVHTLAAGVMTRFFRLRLSTTWGWILYTVLLTPIVLLASTILFTGVVGLGSGVDLGTPVAAVVLLVLLPVVLGAAIDYLYMPPPEEYRLPETR